MYQSIVLQFVWCKRIKFWHAPMLKSPFNPLHYKYLAIWVCSVICRLKIIILFKYNVCDSDTSASQLKVPFAVTYLIYWTNHAAVFVRSVMGKSRNTRTFSKIENLRFLQNYNDYDCIFGIKLKGPIIIFHLKGHAVKLKCVTYKNFCKKHDFC